MVKGQGVPPAERPAVQANIASAGYSSAATSTGTLTPGSRVSLRATTACCTGDYLTYDDADDKVGSAVGSSSSSTRKADATFCPTAGNSGTGTSLRSVNYPTKYLRHYNFAVYVASDGEGNAWDSSVSWAADTSWLAAQPWS